MKTVCIECRQFEEWDEEVQQKILEKHWDINVNYEWYEYTIEDAKEMGKLMGMEIEDIYFSGFSSQGDGACFEGTYRYEKGALKKTIDYAPLDKKLHDIAKNLLEIQKKHFYQLGAKVKHRGHYYHEMCTDIEVYKDGNYMYFKDAEVVEEELQDILRDYMRWIYKKLEEEYDDFTSKESIIETFKANEYEFSEEGEIM